MMMSASRTELNAPNSSTKMMKITSGTMIASRPSARCWSSKRPLQTIW